jgi:SanA protein
MLMVRAALIPVLLSVMLLWWCDRHIRLATASAVFDDLAEVPHNHVGVVLGTSERGRDGRPNLFFAHRIAAAAELYHAGKVYHLLLSGDNGRHDYNEPAAMRRALITAGVDSSAITLDHAGFRTYDSMVRAHAVFGQQRFTVISQRFHNERAIFIARHAGLDAVGFNARAVSGRSGLRTALREKAARVRSSWTCSWAHRHATSAIRSRSRTVPDGSLKCRTPLGASPSSCCRTSPVASDHRSSGSRCSSVA